MPERPLEPTFQTWANDIARRLRAVERYKSRVDFPDVSKGGPYTVCVAAPDTPSPMKERADFICSPGQDAAEPIQAAIDLMESQLNLGLSDGGAGATVQLMSGTYNTSNIIFLSAGIMLRGTGQLNTHISLDVSGVVVSAKNQQGPSGPPFHTYGGIEDLGIYAAQSNSIGFFSLGHFSGGFTPIIRRCHFDVAGGAIAAGAYGGAGGSNNRVIIQDNTFRASVNTGIGATAGTVMVEATSGLLFTGNIYELSGGYALFVDGLSRECIISDNIFRSFVDSHGVLVYGLGAAEGNHNTYLIQDNIFSGTFLTSNTKDAITLGDGVSTLDRCIIMGNRIMASSGTWRYGIVLNSLVSDTTVAHNCVSQFGTGIILNSGTNNMDWMNQCGGTAPIMNGSTLASGREYATVVVAATNTHAAGKAAANFVCDGTADDVEINAALTSLPVVGGTRRGRVLLLEGNYTLAAPIVAPAAPGPIEIVGMGWGTVIVGSGAAGSVDPFISLSGAGANWRLADFRMTGQSTRPNGIVATGSTTLNCENLRVEIFSTLCINSLILRTNIRNCWISGSVITAGAMVDNLIETGVSGAVVTLTGTDAWFSGNYGGYSVTTASGLSGLRTMITNNDCGAITCPADQAVVANNTISTTASTPAISVTGTQPTVRGNTIFTSTTGLGTWSGISCTAPAGARIYGNKIQQARRHGIELIGCDDAEVIGNLITSPGLETNNTYDGIILSNCERVNVQENTIRRADTPFTPGNDPRYGINVSDAACVDCLVTNNDLVNSFVTAALNDAGTNTRIRPGNRGTAVALDLRIRDEGVDQGGVDHIDFTGTGVTATVTGGVATVDVPGGATVDGHVIEDEGTPLTQRANLNFTGDGVTVTDATPDTVVDIPGVGTPTAGWTTSNVTTDRVLDADATTIDELADFVATLVEDLKSQGIISP